MKRDFFFSETPRAAAAAIIQLKWLNNRAGKRNKSNEEKTATDSADFHCGSCCGKIGTNCES